MRSQVERAIFGRAESISREEFLARTRFDDDEPTIDGRYVRMTFDGMSCRIILRHDGLYTPGKGDPIFQSRDECAFRAARLNGLFE